MLGRRLGLTLAVGALVAAPLVSSPASATPAGSAVASSPAAAHPASAARQHKQKKLHLTLVITPFQTTAFTYTWTVLDKHNVPVPGVKFKTQYHAVKGKWSNEGTNSHVSDANGQFTFIGCNISMGPERLYSKATKRHKKITFVYQVRQCGS